MAEDKGQQVTQDAKQREARFLDLVGNLRKDLRALREHLAGEGYRQTPSYDAKQALVEGLGTMLGLPVDWSSQAEQQAYDTRSQDAREVRGDETIQGLKTRMEAVMTGQGTGPEAQALKQQQRMGY